MSEKRSYFPVFTLFYENASVDDRHWNRYVAEDICFEFAFPDFVTDDCVDIDCAFGENDIQVLRSKAIESGYRVGFWTVWCMVEEYTPASWIGEEEYDWSFEYVGIANDSGWTPSGLGVQQEGVPCSS